MRFGLIFSLLFAAVAVTAADAGFKHDVTSEKKPWTHENFQNDPDEFSFIIIPDRTGSERPGVFPEAIRKANLFHPEFIMTVGDLIQGQMDRRHQDHEHLREQWRELNKFTAASAAPFFHIVGNHDICRTREGFPRSNETSREVWEENCGTHTYYSFVYKNVLFLCLNTMEGKDSRPQPVGLTAEQIAWAKDVLKNNPDVRWTMVFLHQPDTCAGTEFKSIEAELVKRNYTVFAGDWHCYVKFQRYNRNYYVLATAGGISKQRGLDYGEFDHLTYVTMTKKGPKVVNIKLDGILNDDVVDAYKIKRPIRRNLDIPRKNIPAANEPAAAVSADGSWKVVITPEMMDKHLKRGVASIKDGTIRIIGNNSTRRWEAIPLPALPAGVRKIKLTAKIRTDITSGRFAVLVRRINSEGNTIDYDGPIVSASQDWKNMTEIVDISSNTAKLQLYIQTDQKMDPNSFGEVRDIVLEAVAPGKKAAKTAKAAAVKKTVAAGQWQVAVTPEMMTRYFNRKTAVMQNGIVRIDGKGARRRWESMPLPALPAGTKKIKLTADIRSDISSGKFSVLVRRINAKGSSIDYDGPIVSASQDWKTMTEIIDISPNTAKLELFIQTNDLADGSFGEVRNIVLEMVK
ncbi:MAG: hypothetical protein E7041_03060 [Lentisphaerae bacterium]|nr:hypothetical protein [Lentisphaerota bacterium]